MTQGKTLLLIDNYDSFTYNLLHYFAELGVEVDVVRNDALTADEVLARYKAGEFDGVVISPGPCNPDKAGICLDVVTKANGELPIFGVCLGHQTIGQAYGGKVVRAGEPVHGKVHAVTHTNTSVFRDLPNPFDATRYHSLVVEEASLPDCLEITARTADGEIMGLSHKNHNVHGVQFHPESIASQHGHDILRNFVEGL